MDPPSSDPGWHTEDIFAQTDASGGFEVRGLSAVEYKGKVHPPQGAGSYREAEFQVNPAEKGSIVIRLNQSTEGSLKVRVSNRVPEQGLIHVVLIPLPPPAPGSKVSTGLIEPDVNSVGIRAQPGRYALVAYTIRGDWVESSPQIVQEKSDLETVVALKSGATLLMTPQRDGKPVHVGRDLQLGAWVYSLGQWRALNFVKAAGISMQTEGDRLRIPAPPGKIQIRVGRTILREVDLSSGQTVDLGAVALD